MRRDRKGWAATAAICGYGAGRDHDAVRCVATGRAGPLQPPSWLRGWGGSRCGEMRRYILRRTGAYDKCHRTPTEKGIGKGGYACYAFRARWGWGVCSHNPTPTSMQEWERGGRGWPSIAPHRPPSCPHRRDVYQVRRLSLPIIIAVR